MSFIWRYSEELWLSEELAVIIRLGCMTTVYVQEYFSSGGALVLAFQYKKGDGIFPSVCPPHM